MRSRRLQLAQALFGILLLGCVAGAAAVAQEVYPSRHADAYILSRDDQFISTNVSLLQIESVRSGFPGDFLWGRRAGKQFMIRDERTLEEAQRLFDSLRQLDPERETLRRRQERLGSEQEALEREEETLDRELDALDEGEHRAPAPARSDLERRRSELSSKMRALEARERDIDADESSLDRRSDALEEKAETALWRLIDRALSQGLGRPVGRD